ncbi:MAG TPA: DUF3016 domain-containing protein [Opitutaceae bacterium]
MKATFPPFSRRALVCLLAGALLFPGLALAAAPKAHVEVTYESPEKFTDARDPADNPDKESSALVRLRRHIEDRAEKILPPGYRLALTVTDVDLAGSYEPSARRPRDVRVVRDGHPPRIDFAYTLTDATGATVSSGKEALRDPGFLKRLRVDSNDDLRFEKAMLDEWLDRIAPKKS